MAPTMAMEIAEPSAPAESRTPDSMAQTVVQAVAAPTDEEIASLAYSLWEARGGVGGSPEEDWLAAEAELRRR